MSNEPNNDDLMPIGAAPGLIMIIIALGMYFCGSENFKLMAILGLSGFMVALAGALLITAGQHRRE